MEEYGGNSVREHVIKYLKVKFLISFLSLLFLVDAHSYVQNRTSNDSLVRWSSNVSTIDIFLNPNNSQGFSTFSVDTIVTSSVSQWDGKSRLSLRKNTTAGTNQLGLNEIYFSNDSSIFNGSLIVGLTQVVYTNNSGEIIEADILLNDQISFSNIVTDKYYLGNVLTHEMGHFLGLGHSQVIGASMFFMLTRGQSLVADDDEAGLYAIYPNGNTLKGSLGGKIIGGNSKAAVFGAHVQAISQTTGKVAGANISEINGSFVIDGLDKNDQYFIYTSPSASVGLPAKYSNAKFDFCNSASKYRGSLFQACGSQGEGFPQAVSLNSNSLDVGNVTIRCSIDVPIDYISRKNSNPAEFEIQHYNVLSVGNNFTGYFSNSDLQNGVADRFAIKLDTFDNVDWSQLSATGDLYLELKILNQSFYSAYKPRVDVTASSGASYSPNAKYETEADGWLNLETTLRLPINRDDSSDNNFEITVTPESMDFPNFPVGLPESKSDYFPSSSDIGETQYFYLATASLVKDNGNGTYTKISSKSEQSTDNSLCPDAANTYSLSDYSVKGSVSGSSRGNKDNFLACGTVDFNGGPGGGPGGFFIGLISGLLALSLISSIFKHIKSKQYSKLA